MIGNEVAQFLAAIDRSVRQAANFEIASLHRQLGHAGRWRRCSTCRPGPASRRAAQKVVNVRLANPNKD